MITRRQFLIGMGAIGASAFLSLTWGYKKAMPQEINSPKPQTEPDPPVECDWVLENAKIIDGTGQPGYWGKVAVKGKHIVAVGDFVTPAGTKVINGNGLMVAPGFIDIHTHTEDYVYSGGSMAPFLSQGLTMQVGGNCGRSPKDIAGFFATVPQLSINYGLLLGYRTLREKAGVANHKKANPSQIAKMQQYLAQELENGALGLSVGLEYAPQHLATTEELCALCEVVREYNGFYATHIRNEYDKVIPALEEAIEIGRRTGVSVQYSHIKAGYERNWDKFPRLLSLLEEAHSSGLDITADVYPYTFSSTDLGIKPFRHSGNEEILEAAITHPLVFVGSDTGIYKNGRAIHPRAYGTFPRVIKTMVKDKGLLTLEEAVAKMTSQPARRLRQPDRGMIKEGYKADLVLFDFDSITDKATLENTTLFSEGIRQVWVNGVLAWEKEIRESLCGEAVTRSGIQ